MSFVKNTFMEEGATHCKAKRYAEALKVYEKAIQCEPGNASVYVGKGDSLRKLKKYRAALSSYERAIGLDPSNVSAYTGICYAYLGLGICDEASVACSMAIELDPKSAAAYNGKGRVLRLRRQYNKALEAFEEAIRLATATDNVAGYYYNKGRVLCDLQRYDEALDAYDQALQRDPENSRYRDAISRMPQYVRDRKFGSWYKNGEIFYEQYLYEQAFQAFEDPISRVPQNIRDGDFDVWYKNGEILYEYKVYKHALQAFERALRIDPESILAHVGRGNTLLELGQYEEAHQEFDGVLQHQHSYARAWVGKGSALLKMKSYEEAVTAFDEAIKLNAQLILAHAGKGHAYFALDRSIDALKSYGEAINLRTDDVHCYINVGEVLTGLHAYDEAIQMYEQALQLAPELVPAHAGKANVLFELKHYEEALVAYGQVLSLDANNVSVCRRIGDILTALNESKKASDIQALHTLLTHLPEEKRAEVLTLIANEDDTRIALLLIHLAPFSLSGLSSLAHQVTLRWVPTPRSDDLVIRFYHVLDSYGVPFEDSDWLFAQELMIEGLYVQVKSVLSDLVKQRPTPDRLWLLATAMWHRKDPAQHQIEVLHQFIASTAPSDARCGEAWKRIGELSIENGDDGIDAIEALKKAEYYGLPTPQLQAFRVGNWDAIPALRTHPDYPFPPVVVIDLESDYQPDALPGSCVFEIGAVCVKGGTEIDVYHAIIRHDRVSPKVAHRQSEAKPLEQVVRELQAFIDKSQGSIEHAIIVGHNLQAFDALHLRAMGIVISDDQIIDTLNFARLLYPDSLHHRLELLRSVHKIPSQGQAHTALPDARVCALLLHRLGDELVRRGERLLAGFRAFVPPGSAFDRAVLQPRDVPANPMYSWSLDPTPTIPHTLASIQDLPASLRILEALDAKTDTLIEHYDPNAAYVQHLPARQRSIVTVSTRARLDRILVTPQEQDDLFVLPDPHTLLCPHRLRQHIEQAENYQMKLTLFCLYQASHNHDARTLYPLRIPSDETTLMELRQTLIASCCESDLHHPDTCTAALAVKVAAEKHCVLLATHESFLHQKQQPEGDLIIVDDADELQMHFAEYVAERITSEQIRTWSMDVFKLLEAQVVAYGREYISNPGFHERIHLSSIVPYLTQPRDGYEKDLLARLKEIGPIGEAIAHKLEGFCRASLQEAVNPGSVHA